MKKKAKGIDDSIRELAENITERIWHWASIRKDGCNDPFWPDGVNMNLVRNHVIYYKRQLEEICAEHGRDLPDEYYLATPPKVDDNYMANLRQTRRVERLRSYGNHLTRKAPDYQPEQMSLF